MLTNTPYMDKKAAREAQHVLKEISQVFFKPVDAVTEVSRKAIDEFAVKRMKLMAQTGRYMKIEDKRKKN